MSNCCNDPTEPPKVDSRELLREQEHFGSLMRDLFTGDPEKVILKQLNDANTYLRELAALRAYHDSVRRRAIGLLGNESASILERIVDQENNPEIGAAARSRLLELESKKSNPVGKIFNKLKG